MLWRLIVTGELMSDGLCYENMSTQQKLMAELYLWLSTVSHAIFLITENIALYKSCDQSTKYSGIVPAETFLADLACDGDESTFMATDNEQLPWLSIDIGNVYTITSVDILFHGHYGMYIELQIMIKFNSLWPSDATWRNWSGSALVQVIAGFLTVPNHYKNQYWPISIEVLCYS